jgi:hypothetical protein
MALVLALACVGILIWRGVGSRPLAPAAGTVAERPPEIETEVEPNDTLLTCQRIPRSADVIVQGQVRAGNDDWYCLPAPFFGAHVTVDLAAVPGCELELGLYDTRGRLVQAPPPAAPRRLATAAETPAARLLLVRPRPGCQPARPGYELRVRSLKRPDTDWEKEPNDTAATATPLRRGVPLVGYLTEAKDVDWYTFPTQPAPPDSRLRFDAWPAAPVALSVRVRGADGGLLYHAAGRAGEPLTMRGIGIRSWEGSCALEVRATEGAGPRLPYVLRAELETVRGPFEFEPNDDAKAATPLPLGAQDWFDLHGYLSTPGDVDMYGLSVMRDAPLELMVDGVAAELGLEATLLDAKGQALLTCRTGQPCGGRPAAAERIALVLAHPARGPLTLRLAAAPGQADAEHPYRVRARYGAAPAR